MIPYSIAPIVMASVSLYAAGPELVLWFRKKGSPDGLPFALTCLGVCLYNVACAGLYNAVTPIKSLPWSRFQATVFCMMGLCFFWFIARHTRLVGKVLLRIIVCVYSVGALVQVISAFNGVGGLADLTWIASKPFVKHVGLPFLFRLEINEVRTGPLSDLFQASGFITFALIVRPVIEYFHSGHRREVKTLGLALGLIGLAFTVDFFVTNGILHIPYTLEYSWIGFILLMGLQRNRQLQEGYEAKRALVDSEIRFRAIVEESFDIIVVCDGDGRALFLSSSFERVLGYSIPEFVGRNLVELVHPEDREPMLLDAAARAEPLGRGFASFRMRKSNGEWALMEAVISSFGIATSRDGFLVTGRDITERKKADDAIVASLREKEILLKEVHHRVKNNLQVISSLLSFQASDSGDPNVEAAIEDSRNQIAAMAAVHEELYRQLDFVNIDLGHCIRGIADELLASSGMSGKVSLEIKTDEVELALDAAIPVALIVNELVSNSLKHAFPGPGAIEGAAIRIDLAALANARASLRISDNGIGLIDSDNEKKQGRGLVIVSSLARQINGTMSVDKAPGFAVAVEFGVGGKNRIA